ncbi:ABC transporter permease [Oscillospiraceae bacterium MB08-C2-2]|nr:ABC transporter permease [Oscillospiraceae bacterium MB08-C2-2]
MKISDLLAMCVQNLTRRKMRTFLTVMGVVIGTCSIVVMISLGVGINASQEQMLAEAGDLTVIEINGGRYSGDAVSLNDEAVKQIQALPNVEIATPVSYGNFDGSVNLVTGRKDRYSMWMSPTLIYPEAIEKLGYEITQGESFPSGYNTKVIPVILGSQAVYDFRDTKKKRGGYIRFGYGEGEEMPDPYFDPMDSEFTLKMEPQKEGAKTLEYKVKVVGILKQDYAKGWETANGVFMRVDDFRMLTEAYNKENSVKLTQDQKKEKSTFQTVKVKATELKYVAEVEAAIKEMGFNNTWSMESYRQSLQKSAQQIQLILGGIGAITLFVAAISITNTMIMSVYERTREIGVMKVLGCLVSNIRQVFLVEAGLIGFFGGVIGVGLSYLLSYLLNTFGGSLGESLGMGGMAGAKMSIIPLWLVLLGMSFATFIGIGAGFYPANRAVRISALEAIKQE